MAVGKTNNAQKQFHVSMELLRYQADPRPQRYTDAQLEAIAKRALEVNKPGIAKAIKMQLHGRSVLRNEKLKAHERSFIVEDRSVDGRIDFRGGGRGISVRIAETDKVSIADPLAAIDEIIAGLQEFREIVVRERAVDLPMNFDTDESGIPAKVEKDKKATASK